MGTDPELEGSGHILGRIRDANIYYKCTLTNILHKFLRVFLPQKKELANM